MMRGMTVLWGILALGIGIALFLVKYQVQETEADLRRVQAQIRADRSALHVLNAEWTFLNDPARLTALATRVLGLEPIAPHQMVSMSTLPIRPSALPGETGDDGRLYAEMPATAGPSPWVSYPRRKPGPEVASAGGDTP